MNLSDTLSIVYITARAEPEFGWISPAIAGLKTVIVDAKIERTYDAGDGQAILTAVKPNIWQGKYRVTQEDWWNAAAARNTGICHVKTPWVMFLDDRSVLLPGWHVAIEAAIAGNYAVCGAYEKHAGMTVHNGVIQEWGEIIGQDGRYIHCKKNKIEFPYQFPSEWAWMYGCCFALPVEWYLNVNGQDETSGGSSAEDTFFSLMLANNGYPIKYDARCMLAEDRTPAKCGPRVRREDKGVSPNDKSHALLARLRGRKTAEHYYGPFDLRAQRDSILCGGQFPLPEEKEYMDWYDGQLVKDFK